MHAFRRVIKNQQPRTPTTAPNANNNKSYSPLTQTGRPKVTMSIIPATKMTGSRCEPKLAKQPFSKSSTIVALQIVVLSSP